MLNRRATYRYLVRCFFWCALSLVSLDLFAVMWCQVCGTDQAESAVVIRGAGWRRALRSILELLR